MSALVEHVYATGFAYPEGPRFDADGVLHVVELAGGVVSRVVDGEREVLSRPGGSPNGAGFTADGMPVGLQVIGPQHADALVLRAIAALEQIFDIDTVAPLPWLGDDAGSATA